MEISTLDLRVAGTREAILMVECGAQEVSEDLMVEAPLAHQEIQGVVELQERMAREVGKQKKEVELRKFWTPEPISQARASVETRLKAILDQPYSKENMYGHRRTAQPT